MTPLIFATHNANKVKEIRAVLRGSMNLLTLTEAGIHSEIPEPHDTLEANAREKSQTIHRLTGADCFSEDTGLEVEALGGAPGVRSARYAGEPANTENNIRLLLQRMEGQIQRRARFRTVISLIWKATEYQFEGVCTGTLTTACRGNAGFGYDPIFIPDGADKTFAEMELEEKNRFSHRKKAVMLFTEFLNAQHGSH